MDNLDNNSGRALARRSSRVKRASEQRKGLAMTAAKGRASRAGNVFQARRGRGSQAEGSPPIGETPGAEAPVDKVPAASAPELDAAQWLDALLTRGEREVFAEVVDITRERAVVMLARNDNNRRVRRGLVVRLRDDIEKGRWQLNGETIVFASTGELNDGQHRLEAIADAGAPVRAVVVFGVTRESRTTLDLGATRQPGDVLHFLGHTHAIALASATRLVLAYERGNGVNLDFVRWLSKAEVVERAEHDKAIADAVHWASTTGTEVRHLIPASPLAFLRVILRRVDPRQADDYLRGLVTGAGLPTGAPALSVRRHLFTVSNRSRAPLVAMCLRGWVLYAQGRTAQPGDIHGRSPFPGIGLVEGDLGVDPAEAPNEE